MNLATTPKEALDRMQQHPMARKLGAMTGWSEDDFYATAAHVYGLPFREVKIGDIDANLFRSKESFFVRAGQLPLKLLPDMLIVTECEPWDERKLQDLIQEFELGVKRVIITQRNFDHLLGTLSHYQPPTVSDKKQDVSQHVFFPNSAWDNVSESKILMESIRRADLMQASDIHLEPADGCMRIRYRVHGNLLVQRKLTTREGDEVMKSLKLEAHLLSSAHGTFQSSRIRAELPHGKTIDLRVEVSPTVDGDSVVMRLLDSKSINRSVDDLRLPKNYFLPLMESISKASGLIIVTGPTGSGKTTTLYTLLQHLNNKDTKIITIEDPVEYRVKGFSQIQIEPDKGITFPNAIRSCMRQDPDIMLIGEVRDEETAKLCVAAAETGHLVFTTLHTNNAIETLSRLDRLGVDRFQLQTLIRLVMAQRLIGVLCPDCKTAREMKTSEIALLNKLNISFTPKQLVYDKRGCSRCNGVGTTGRTAVYSFFIPTEKSRALMGTDCPIMDIINKAKEEGFKTIMENALVPWLAGTACFSEVHSLED